MSYEFLRQPGFDVTDPAVQAGMRQAMLDYQRGDEQAFAYCGGPNAFWTALEDYAWRVHGIDPVSDQAGMDWATGHLLGVDD